MSSVVLQCPLCTQPFGVLPEQAGQAVQCPHCNQAVMVPESEPATSSPPPVQTPPPVQAPPHPQPNVMSCPVCTGQFGITPEMAGQTVACPHCESPVRIPGGKEDDSPDVPKIKLRRRKKPKIEIDDSELFAPGYQPKKQKPSIGPSAEPKAEEQAEKSPERTKREAASASESNAKAKPSNPQSESSGATPKKSRSSKRSKKSQTDTASKAAPASAQPPVPTDPQPAESTASKPLPADLMPPQSQDHAPASQPTSAPATPRELEQTAVTGGVAQFVSESERPTDDVAENFYEPANVEHLLPPTFDVIDPKLLALRSRSNQDNKVILPDGKGGHNRVDGRIITIIHNGEEVDLIALPPDELQRKRRIQNFISILIGAIVLAVVFALLKKSG